MPRSFRRIVPTALMLALTGLPALSVQAQSATYAFDIPSQPLSEAIRTATRQAPIQILYIDHIPGSLNAPALQGRYTARQALEHLLRGSGLGVRDDGGMVFTIASTRPAASLASQDGVSRLAPVRVRGQADAFDVRPGRVTTATRVAMDIKDIPQALDTVDTQRYRDYGIDDLSSMVEGVSNIDVSPDMRADSITIRGFAAQSGDIYLDGIRASGQIRHSTANIERIEVLKGPASVLYGRGSGGGIINQVSKQARFGQDSTVSIRGGSWRTGGATVDINRELGPNVAVRLTADVENGHSFRDGIQYRNRMFSPSILYDNHRNFSWLLQYTYDKAWRVPDRGPSWEVLPDDLSMRRAFAHPDDYVEDELHYLRSDMKYAFNDQWALRWVVGWRSQSQNFDHVYSGTVCNANQINPANGARCRGANTLQGQVRAWQLTDNTTLTTNLDLTGKFRWLGVEHDLLVGADLSREQRLPKLATERGIIPPVDLYHPVRTPKPAPGPATQDNQHQATARAIYLQDLISFTPQWKLMLGLRTEQFRFRSLNKLNGQSRAYSGTTTSPRAGLIWQPVPEHSLYLSYSKNFSPYGGSGLLSVSVDQAAVYNESPEYSRQYEFGIKSDWLGGDLSTQLAVFNLERYNIRYRPDPINEPDRWDVAGKERTRGVELSVAGRMARDWYVRGSVGVQSAKVVQAVNNPARENQYKTGIARYNGSLFVSYAPAQGFFAETGVTFTGPRWTDIPNVNKQSGYTRWDALLGYRAKQWQASVAVTNLTDRRYWRTSTMPGQPRTIMANVRYQF